MGAETGIQWTDATWNPVRGCSRISPGCEHCYAETMAARFSAEGQWAHGFALRSPARWTRKVALVPEMLDVPLRWREPQRIFVNSMSDLFHESLSDEDIAAVFGVMAAAPQHTFQVLTKRAERLPDWFEWIQAQSPSQHPHGATRGALWYAWNYGQVSTDLDRIDPHRDSKTVPWPLPNVWIGVSVEDQQRADERIPHLLKTPAAVRFLSCEPLLGPVTLFADNGEGLLRGPAVVVSGGMTPSTPSEPPEGYDDSYAGVDWVIVGGESGPGARPMRLEWARSIVKQCRDAGTKAFVKQLGAWPLDENAPPTVTIGPDRVRLTKDRKGGDPAEWPEDLRVREFPR